MNPQDHLKAYLDGELGIHEASLVEAAIQSNPILAKELEELRLVGEVVQTVKQEYSPVGMEETLRKIKPGQKNRWLNQLGIRPFGWSVALVALVGLIWLIRPTVFSGGSSADQASFVARKSNTNVAAAAESATAPAASVPIEKQLQATKSPSTSSAKAVAGLNVTESDQVQSTTTVSKEDSRRWVVSDAKPVDKTRKKQKDFGAKLVPSVTKGEPAPRTVKLEVEDLEAGSLKVNLVAQHFSVAAVEPDKQTNSADDSKSIILDVPANELDTVVLQIQSAISEPAPRFGAPMSAGAFGAPSHQMDGGSGGVSNGGFGGGITNTVKSASGGSDEFTGTETAKGKATSATGSVPMSPTRNLSKPELKSNQSKIDKQFTNSVLVKGVGSGTGKKLLPEDRMSKRVRLIIILSKKHHKAPDPVP